MKEACRSSGRVELRSLREAEADRGRTRAEGGAARGRSDTITISVLEMLKQENPKLYRQIYVPSTRNISQFGIHFKMTSKTKKC
jgi:hypothetical protein